jgi:hypothetical protein
MAMTLSPEEFDGNVGSSSKLIREERLSFLVAAFLRSHLLRQFAITVAVLLLNVACSRTPQTGQSASSSDEWHEFQGIWTAAGSRDSIPLGGGRRASIAKLEGSLVLAGASRPGVGFRAEALILNDSASGTIGRAVWTDDRGDQVFSELTGQGTSTGSHIVGKFLGGTGTYAGATGSYGFSWRFVLETEDGNLQGQSEGLNGRIRAGPAQATPDAGGPR